MAFLGSGFNPARITMQSSGLKNDAAPPKNSREGQERPYAEIGPPGSGRHSLNRQPDPTACRRIIFSDNRVPLLGIML
jgi:hypothetical protein